MHRIFLLILVYVAFSFSMDVSLVFYDSTGNMVENLLETNQKYTFEYPTSLADSQPDYSKIGFVVKTNFGLHFYFYHNGNNFMKGYTKYIPKLIPLQSLDTDTNQYLFKSFDPWDPEKADTCLVTIQITGEGWISICIPSLLPAHTGSTNILKTPIIKNQPYQEHLHFHTFDVKGIVKGSMKIFIDDVLFATQDSLFTGYSQYSHEILDTIPHVVTLVTFDVNSSLYDSVSYFIHNTSPHPMKFFEGWYETSLNDSLYIQIDGDNDILIEKNSNPWIIRDNTSNVVEFTSAKLVIYKKSSNIESVDISFKQSIEYPYTDRYILANNYTPGAAWVFGEIDIITRGESKELPKRSDDVVDTLKITITQKNGDSYIEKFLCWGYYHIVGIEEEQSSLVNKNKKASVFHTSNYVVINLPEHRTKTQCHVYNIFGQKILDVISDRNRICIEKDKLPAGAYFLKPGNVKTIPFSIVK